MTRDYAVPLWLLKLGTPINLFFLAESLAPGARGTDPHLLVPAQILFAVSAYRCLFPNRYEGNVVLHDSVLSSTGVTRILATFSEVAYIYQFATVLRLLNVDGVAWVDGLATLMLAQVVVSQAFVWSAIATGRLSLYVYEEIGWAVIFLANTIASGFLLATADPGDGRVRLLVLSLAFGCVYLPWQAIHLHALRTNSRAQVAPSRAPADDARSPVLENLARAFRERKCSTQSSDWGGWVGLTWMTAYWATLIPLWVHVVVTTFHPG